MLLKTTFFWAWLLTIPWLGANYGCAQNIALNKKYTVSEKPNYHGSAPSTDTKSLTDGVYTSIFNRRFWSSKTTVGWSKKSEITIDIDLENAHNIEAITLNSAAGKGNVYFPQNIFAFMSIDGKEYEYIGDLMKGEKNKYGNYKVKKFKLNTIKRKGQYIRLIVLPDKNYFFTDEIEVLASKEEERTAEKKISREETHYYSTKIKEDNLKKKRLENLRTFYAEKSIPVRNESNQEKQPSTTKDLDLRLAQYLLNKFDQELILENQSPWDVLTSNYIPESHSNTLEYSFKIPKNQHRFSSFTLTNSSSHKKRLKIGKEKAVSDPVDIAFFHSVFTETGEINKVSDALVPLDSTLSLAPGETAHFFIKLKGKKEGQFKQQIKINADNDELHINLSGTVQQEVNPNLPHLNANVWAYLDYPSLMDIQEKAGKDLQSHYINTAVIKRNVLPDINKPKKLQEYKKVLHAYRDIDYILLYVPLNNDVTKDNYWQSDFLSTQWRSNFIEWYETIEKETKKIFPEAKIYFYPYDEISSEKDIRDFNKLLDWANKDFPKLKFYATLNREENINDFIHRVDIAQIHPEDMALSKVNNTTSEVWTYKNTAEARKSSPYRFYRMKAWVAYLNGSKGIGFWNYAHKNGKDKSEYVYNLNLDFSVVYNFKDDLLSSRRWEAFAKGLEDYTVLKAYEEKNGRNQTLLLVKKVLDHPEDTYLADKIISEVIDSI